MATKSITTEVADKVAAAILRSGKSKSAVAEAAGIPLSTFNRKINAHTDFTVREIDEIAHVLGLSAADLVPERFQAAA